VKEAMAVPVNQRLGNPAIYYFSKKKMELNKGKRVRRMTIEFPKLLLFHKKCRTKNSLFGGLT
jgi:hypothetical protein